MIILLILLNILTKNFEIKRDSNPACYTIDLGLHDRSKPDAWSITRNVERIIIHEKFDPEDLRNDIALLKLDVSSLI